MKHLAQYNTEKCNNMFPFALYTNKSAQESENANLQ